ncbi:PHP domain-containing protein [Pasteurella skyensis]|uniref:PHP domain-containing protein n=1 Tax=Phocoenobacter skyensis TaxID=97481 RepID=A0AAJ6P1F6_9PAST|nr:PHP domain-containing protein [Pasteurella skyensis]MDP8163360.1 PHP domain-containing protein [Pasteurella skyensis]MDP8173583.1 PHP domain-containing protein [Pasteurella skyensis]MDP8177860.1 PHP domain-containing protein [Pasteurella skyensis]MDP8179790.1 PHP domain-containing protein [Pasteurella skyensis]MDP8183904.1 PHP domain-containing protein [Pasteurella skyensis]
MIYDLHSHSTASDGLLTPTELVNRAVEKGIDVLALTDHDTIAGLVEARQATQTLPIQLISGVEISVVWQNKNIHLSALNFDENNQKLVNLLQNQTALREQRAIQIAEKLAKVGILNAYEGAKALAEGEITRAHYARFLVEIEAVKSMEKAFKKYLGQGKSAYVKPMWCSMEDAIDTIHQAGGVINIAHPLRYKLTARWIKRLITAFKEAGGDGIEVAGCGQSKDQRQLLARWAEEFELYASVGSDFHFPTQWLDLGKDLSLPTNCKPIWELWERAS